MHLFSIKNSDVAIIVWKDCVDDMRKKVRRRGVINCGGGGRSCDVAIDMSSDKLLFRNGGMCFCYSVIMEGEHQLGSIVQLLRLRDRIETM